MDFNLRVFISSTSVNLVEYRQAADRAIRALGATSDDMILWSADSVTRVPCLWIASANAMSSS